MDTYNGFTPNEIRVQPWAGKKTGTGHDVTLTAQKRLGTRWVFKYIVACECGKRYTSRTDMMRAFRSHEAHQKKEQA